MRYEYEYEYAMYDGTSLELGHIMSSAKVSLAVSILLGCAYRSVLPFCKCV